MPTKTYNEHTFDAFPYHIELRDRAYQHKLVLLPSGYPDIESIDQFLPAYARKPCVGSGCGRGLYLLRPGCGD